MIFADDDPLTVIHAGAVALWNKTPVYVWRNLDDFTCCLKNSVKSRPWRAADTELMRRRRERLACGNTQSKIIQAMVVPRSNEFAASG
jgi:hypothetical protein